MQTLLRNSSKLVRRHRLLTGQHLLVIALAPPERFMFTVSIIEDKTEMCFQPVKSSCLEKCSNCQNCVSCGQGCNINVIPSKQSTVHMLSLSNHWHPIQYGSLLFFI